MKLKNLFAVAFALSGMFASNAWAGHPPANPAWRAVEFGAYETLTSKQQELLATAGIDNDSKFQVWAADHDGEASAFVGITQALERTTFVYEDGSIANALELVKSIVEFKADRIYVQMDAPRFEAWLEYGRFELGEANGKIETGRVKFRNEDDWFGSVHKDFDIQGYTSRFQFPRIQWNYRFSDGVADIDLDRYAPFLWGFIPNFRHNTWRNSDVRYWIRTFIGKFGALPFKVVKR